MRFVRDLDPDIFRQNLKLFLQGDPHARRTFPKEAGPALLKLARFLGKGLPDDILPEAVAEMWTNLLAKPIDDYDPTRGTAEAYLRGALLNAVKAVRASYSAPGQPTRQRRKPNVIRTTQTPTATPREFPEPDIEDIKDGHAMERIRSWADAKRILLHLAAPRVARTLVALHFEGATLVESAEREGVSRHHLGRAVRAFTERMQEEFFLAAA